ncbi:cupin domain-containing protein [Janthinobacterium fluminis]|uniref:Cupin domain-containing protein n=1 Tax=Janthinobacterium fluminis TaxID=2987524 RepID=A0ABT5K6V6_9BURK|nr:cupin domain-containing protein [Janthinobacterium fluminis]MDC8760634.1 cupin domain-containing protein [Janthinobacterium fluminis]
MSTSLPFIDFELNQQSFREHYFEIKPFLQAGAFRPDLLPFSELADTLFAIDLFSNRIRLFKDGLVPKPEYIENYQDGNSVSSRFRSEKMNAMLTEGATLVIDRIDQNIPVVNKLCFELSQYLGEQCFGNAYVAFGGNGSFGRHWDTHCVFALQLAGKKRWRVYPPTHSNPLIFQGSGKEDKENLGEPVIDICLQAGDILYIPRGWWHDVTPIDGEETLHIAAGIHTSKIHDYMSWICAEILPKIDMFRSTCGRLGAGSFLTEEVVEVLKKEMLNEENIKTFKSKMEKMSLLKQKIDFDNICKNIKPVK